MLAFLRRPWFERVAPWLIGVACAVAWYRYARDVVGGFREFLVASVSAFAAAVGFLIAAQAILTSAAALPRMSTMRRSGKLPRLYSWFATAINWSLIATAACGVGLLYADWLIPKAHDVGAASRPNADSTPHFARTAIVFVASLAAALCARAAMIFNVVVRPVEPKLSDVTTPSPPPA